MDMAEELTVMARYIRACLTMTAWTVKASTTGPTAEYLKDRLRKGRRRGRGGIFGRMGRFTTENSKTMTVTEQVSYIILMVKDLKDLGRTGISMVKGLMCSLTDKCT